MAPRLDIDERLQLLRNIRDEGHHDKTRDAAAKYLADTSNLVVAEAAKLIQQHEFAGTESALISAWNRLVDAPDRVKADRGCTAKSAILQAMGSLNHDDPDFYLAAIHYQQLEPIWGGTQDTAENVRGNAAFALARSRSCRAVDKLIAFVKLYHGSRSDQVNAARAIADTGSESAIPLLHLMMASNADPEVLAACFSGLLQLASDSSIPFIAPFLNHPVEEIVLEAAAALGQYGRPAAVAILIAAWNKTAVQEMQRSFLLSIGLSRDKSATDFLVSKLPVNDDAETVLEALKPACVYQETQDRIRKVLETIGDKKLVATFLHKVARDR